VETWCSDGIWKDLRHCQSLNTIWYDRRAIVLFLEALKGAALNPWLLWFSLHHI
jgi:hypothetical protein